MNEDNLTRDRYFMARALALAARAEEVGETPVGALVVAGGAVIGEGFNEPIRTHDPTGHAEIRALRQAAGHQGNYRLPGATLYVTLEPCLMCAGAIVHARIARLVFGCSDPKAGAVGSVYDILGDGRLNHTVEVASGVLAAECAQILRRFFAARRKKPAEGAVSG